MRIFKEEQRFKQQWLIALLVIGLIIPIVVFSKAYADGKMDLTDYVIAMSLVILPTGFIFFFKLKTRIDEQGIHYRFIPFHFKYKTIPWNDIENIYIRKYDAISEYGGWGMKGGLLWKKENGVAYNVSGEIGIQIELKNSKRILIGTLQEEKALTTITHYKKVAS